jgi:hypothetical protein
MSEALYALGHPSRTRCPAAALDRPLATVEVTEAMLKLGPAGE